MGSHCGIRRGVALLLAVLLFSNMTVAYALLMAVWPEASGEQVLEEGSMTVDASHTEDGYLQIRAQCGNKLKLRISKGDITYTYDLNGDNNYEVFPLQFGSGDYVCTLYENVKSNKFAKNAELSVSVALKDENAAFICPSQYVNYTPDSPAVLKSEELCDGLASDQEKMDAVHQFMVENFVYDFERAASSPAAYLGDVNGCFETRTGLCQDLAAVAASMLRVQGIPTQLVIGYVGNYYHAWNNVYIDGEWKFMDITGELGGFVANMPYTPERYY